MTTTAIADPEALPEDAGHRFYMVPSYPEYEGICECKTAFGPCRTRRKIRRDYREHFVKAAEEGV